MKIFLSPAKRLNEKSTAANVELTEPVFLKQSKIIMQSLKKKSVSELIELQGISHDLAYLNYERNHTWTTKLLENSSLQAGWMFDGEVYRGLHEENLNKKEILYLQENLMILSGLYGILRITDQVLPYRLEMGTALQVGTNQNLYEFWQKSLTNYVNKQIQKDEILLDLSSKEYMSVLDQKKLKGKIIQVKFMDMHQGKLKQITVYFKQARGRMAHFCAKTQAKSLEDLKQFNEMNYVYDVNLSTENTLIFTR
ncbi:MAG: peroxide stress protein YaaA [Flavobacteriaceae bacterium]|nr:peroxide stress protein YaaA [Flavobacteriaceae bacterium]